MAVWLKASTFCDGPVLPTKDLSAAVSWHTAHFGMQEVARTDTTVTLKRGGDADGSPEISLCFAVNGQDPENDGAAIRVQDAAVARAELETAGVSTGNWRNGLGTTHFPCYHTAPLSWTPLAHAASLLSAEQRGSYQVDHRDGEDHRVFFAKEPGGLCYCFYQPLKMLRGLSAFPITPQSDDGIVDTPTLKKLVGRLVDARVDSIGLLGSTGTYAYLSREERRRAVQAAAEVIKATPEGKPKPKLFVGIGHVRTTCCIEMAMDAQKAGADAGLLAPVSYTPLLDEEVFEHFAAVAKAVPNLPLIIYNNPSTTKFKFSNELVGRLANELGTSVVGIKSGGGPDGTDHGAAHAALATAVGERATKDFSIGYAGDWKVIGPLLGGGEAWYSVLAGVFPERCFAILNAVESGDAEAANRLGAELQPLFKIMAEMGSLRVVYAICNILGLTDAAPPRPLLPLPAVMQDAIKAALISCKLIDP